MKKKEQLLNECIKMFNDKVMHCLNTWINIPEEEAYKIKRYIKECVQFLRSNISDCKYLIQPDGDKAIVFHNPYLYDNYGYLGIISYAKDNNNTFDNRIECRYYKNTTFGFSFAFYIENSSITLTWSEDHNDGSDPIYTVIDDKHLEIWKA